MAAGLAQLPLFSVALVSFVLKPQHPRMHLLDCLGGKASPAVVTQGTAKSMKRHLDCKNGLLILNKPTTAVVPQILRYKHKICTSSGIVLQPKTVICPVEKAKK